MNIPQFYIAHDNAPIEHIYLIYILFSTEGMAKAT